MFNKFISLAILLITFSSVKAQGIFPPIQNFSSNDYGKQFSPENYCAAQDENGILYFGSMGNVLQYDGESWRNIPTLSNKPVRSLHAFKGKMYVGTYNNFGFLESDKSGHLQYISLSDSLPSEFGDFMDVWSIVSSEEALYFHSQEQIFEFKQGVLKPIQMPSIAHTVFIHNNSLIARMRGKGLMRLQNNDWTFLPGSEDFSLYGVFGIIDNGENDLIVTQEVGFWELTKNDSVRKKVVENEDFLNNLLIYGAKKLANGMIALQTYDKGVVLTDDFGRKIGQLNKRTGLRVNDVKAIFEDRDDNVWLPLGNGIALVNFTSSLSYFNESNGLFGNVESMVYANKNQDIIYVGTSGGLYVSSNDEKDVFAFQKIPNQNSGVWDIKNYNNQLLVATSNGFYVMPLIQDGTIEEIRRLSYETTNAILIDEQEGNIIIAGSFGYRVLDLNLREKHTTNAGLATVANIVKDPKSQPNEPVYWMSMLGQGVLKVESFDGFFMDSFFSGNEVGLYDDNMTVPFEFDNKIIFGSVKGLLEVIKAKEQGEEFEYFDVAPIYDSIVEGSFYLLKHNPDRTWFAIDNQIGYVDNKTIEFVNRPFWGINYGRINNFYIPETSKYLWIGAADGVIRYELNKATPEVKTFETYIRNLTYQSDSILYAGNGNSKKSNITIPYYQNQINFIFAAPYYQDKYPLEYSYKLVGSDNHWSNWSNRTEKEFSNLHEGRYTFQVKARNVYHTESEIGSISFTITPPWYRTVIAYAVYVLLFILIIYLIMKFTSARLKRKNEELEQIVQERTEEIAQQNEALEEQKDEILHQKTAIEDSINYAERIQRAILPLNEDIATAFKDSFVLFWPKDVVSGDFYWFAQVGDEHVFVCADCTGHGVPGAFMSMIGSDKLNVCVLEKGITSPDKILSFLNQGIKSSLKQEADKETTRDGMDAAIVTVNFKTKTLLYSGANRALWRVRNGELEETKATKVAVGGFTPNDQEYALEKFDIQKEDRFYMSTDGYADQFGGDRGKKFKVKAMKDLILEIHNQPMDWQGKKLGDTMTNWMDGKHEQIDDICVVGIHISDEI